MHPWVQHVLAVTCTALASMHRHRCSRYAFPDAGRAQPRSCGNTRAARVRDLMDASATEQMRPGSKISVIASSVGPFRECMFLNRAWWVLVTPCLYLVATAGFSYLTNEILYYKNRYKCSRVAAGRNETISKSNILFVVSLKLNMLRYNRRVSMRRCMNVNGVMNVC